MSSHIISHSQPGILSDTSFPPHFVDWNLLPIASHFPHLRQSYLGCLLRMPVLQYSANSSRKTKENNPNLVAPKRATAGQTNLLDGQTPGLAQKTRFWIEGLPPRRARANTVIFRWWPPAKVPGITTRSRSLGRCGYIQVRCCFWRSLGGISGAGEILHVVLQPVYCTSIG